MTLTRRILLLFAIVLPVALIAIFSFNRIKEDDAARIFKERGTLSSLSARILKEKLDRLTNLGVSFATRPVVRQFVGENKWDAAIGLLENVPADFRFIDQVMLVDTLGTLMADTPPHVARGTSFKSEEWYTETMIRKSFYLSSLRKSTTHAGQNIAMLTIPIDGAKGKLTGILVLQVRVASLLEWDSEVGIGNTGFAYVVDQKGNIAANPDIDPDSLVDYSAVPAVQKALAGEKNTEILYNPIVNENRISAYEKVPDYGWAVIVQQQADAAFASADNLQFIFVFYVFVVIAAGILAWFIMQEVSNRIKRGEDKVASSEKQYKHLFENMLNGFAYCKVLFDKDGNACDYIYLRVNDEFKHLTGLQHPEGRKVSELIPGLLEMDPDHLKRMGIVSLTGKHEKIEMHVAPLNSWFSISFYSPEKEHFVALFDNITERKKIEQKVEASEKRFRALVEHAQDVILLNGRDGKVTYVSPALEKLTGYSLEAMRAVPREKVLDDEQWKETWRIFNLAIANPGVPFPRVDRLLHIKGHNVRVEGTTINLLNDENVQAVVTNYHDITERKLAEEKLRASEANLNTIFENISEGIILIGVDGSIKSINTTAIDDSITSNSEKLQIGRNLLEYLDDSRKQFFLEAMDLASKGEIVEYEHSYPTTNGQIRWVEVSLNPALRDDIVTEICIVTRNVTEKKKSENEIRSLNSELEERVRQRTAQLEAVNNELEGFTYSVSHDLRSPLRIIDGFSQILIEDYYAKLDDEGQKTLNIIMANAKRMGALIDDLLDFSRLGKYHLRISEIDMNELVTEVVHELRDSGTAASNAINIHSLENAKGDVNLIKQVWTNLISNAIKYSGKKEDPKIEIGMTSKEGKPVYYIKDNGAGFDMKYYHKLFGVFQRLHHQQEFTGTGVGLALTNRILSRHNGSIWASAKINEGAEFYFMLPQ